MTRYVVNFRYSRNGSSWKGRMFVYARTSREAISKARLKAKRDYGLFIYDCKV